MRRSSPTTRRTTRACVCRRSRSHSRSNSNSNSNNSSSSKRQRMVKSKVAEKVKKNPQNSPQRPKKAQRRRTAKEKEVDRQQKGDLQNKAKKAAVKEQNCNSTNTNGDDPQQKEQKSEAPSTAGSHQPSKTPSTLPPAKGKLMSPDHPVDVTSGTNLACGHADAPVRRGAPRKTPPSATGPIAKGKLTMWPSRVLGYGSCGTMVFFGQLEQRQVAVKRMLKQFYDVALREIGLLLESDEHPNVVRYFAREEDDDFIYLALSYCEQTLTKFVEHREVPTVAGIIDSVTKQIMTEIMSGIRHIHQLSIIHRDLKPDNILIDSSGHARISDMGLAKKIQGTHYSCSGSNAGSIGWQSPEVLEGASRIGRGVDVFALGCILYYVATKRHPFGSKRMREANIIANNFNLVELERFPLLHDLVGRMIQHDPQMRITVDQAIAHPFFWQPQRVIQFLLAASDRLEIEKPAASIVQEFESGASDVAGWNLRLDPVLVADLGHHRKYNYDSRRDLLRVVRNKASHYYDLDAGVQAALGPLPDGFLTYFTARFPRLVMHTYALIAKHCAGERVFQTYFTTDPAQP
eukprot:TRINITY_DN71_c1_g4_i2.p1 TRINITY_DN71_c1_g4~~TRINITY_DN71_c1_g4_i2.p1  ORF type:complete len:575 (-),score=124.35 TRINITY_DN71_c1_g4_i2:19-1743(-)